jgi:8-oxo-dGTP diphosphatase
MPAIGQDKYEKFHVGVNVFVIKNGQLLLGKRKNIYGSGSWNLPGGHLEKNEKMEDGALRELFEETGLKGERAVFLNLVNDIREDEHYLQIGFFVEDFSGEVQVSEPDRCERWEWFDFDDLPKEIFVAHKKQIASFFEKKNFVDS